MAGSLALSLVEHGLKRLRKGASLVDYSVGCLEIYWFALLVGPRVGLLAVWKAEKLVDLWAVYLAVQMVVERVDHLAAQLVVSMVGSLDEKLVARLDRQTVIQPAKVKSPATTQNLCAFC